MIPVMSPLLFTNALACLADHKQQIGSGFRGRFVQIFLGLKFFQNNIPSMYSGAFITTELLQSLLDDLFSKASRPSNECVLSIFEGNFLARTGLIAPGNKTSQNTWRNNFNLQKGVGCYAPVADLSSPTFLNQPRLDCRHLQVASAGSLAGARCSLCLSGAAYRNESHRKWLRIDPAGSGYAVTDLQNVANFLPYVAPGGSRIPLLPLIVALYHDADQGLSIGTRTAVSLKDFASDFNFSRQEISAYFDVSMNHPINARLARSAAWQAGSGLGILAPTPPPALPLPVLGGTPAPPPNTNNGWDAEQYVASALTAAGWTVHDVSRQQLGYDMLAQRGSQRRYVEVKSSLGMCSPSLTAREWQQANYHAANYVLAIVENFNAAGQNFVYWIRDPVNRCISTKQTTISHTVSRASWIPAVVALSAL